MSSRRVIPLGLLLLTSAGVSACGVVARLLSPGSASCGPASTVTQTSGSVHDSAGARIFSAFAYLSHGEHGAGTLQATISTDYELHGAPLRGHLTRARLVGPAEDVLLELPTTPPLTLYDVGIAGATRTMPDDATYSMLRTALLSGQAAFILDTEVRGFEHVVVPQRLVEDRPMSRGHCE